MKPWARSVSYPVLITSQPRSRAVLSGANATSMLPQASAIRWLAGGFLTQSNLVPQATNTSLTITNAQLTGAGNYSFVATNLFGAVTSAPAILFVYTNAAQLAAQLAGPASFRERPVSV